jgi:GTP cyclohydrolase II
LITKASAFLTADLNTKTTLNGKHLAELSKQGAATLPTPFGTFRLIAFAKTEDDLMPNLALVAEGTNFEGPVICRVHSECLTGDIFYSFRCDCGEQLQEAMRITGENGGVILYLRQEGRGIGIINKLKAYELQDEGADTIEANKLLGLPVDGREYDQAIYMAKSIGIKSVRLLTNNPLKVRAFEQGGITVSERLPLEIAKRPENERYLNTKRDAMGHQLD